MNRSKLHRTNYLALITPNKFLNTAGSFTTSVSLEPHMSWSLAELCAQLLVPALPSDNPRAVFTPAAINPQTSEGTT